MVTPTLNWETARQNITDLLSNVYTMVGAISYITGVALIFRGLGMYRAFGQHITMQSRGGEFAGPLVYIIIGALLVYLPTTLDSSLITIFGSTELGTAQELMGQLPASMSTQWQDLSTLVTLYMKVVGLIAFVRGLLILAKMGQAGEQPGKFAKGMTHLVGGILMYNFVTTLQMIADLFGYSM